MSENKPLPVKSLSRFKAVGASIGIAAHRLWTRLYDIATFSYDGTQYRGEDIQFITPNERFYVVTKNVIDPQVNPDLWRLEIAGLVERQRSYTYQELTALPPINQETTLMCISNPVGGGLMSNAFWKGVPLRILLENAGPKNGVTKVVLRAVDSYDDTISLAKAMEPTTLLSPVIAVSCASKSVLMTETNGRRQSSICPARI